MKPKKRLLSVALAVSLVTVSVLPGYRYMSAQQSVGEYQVKQTKWKYGLGEALGFNESTYRSIDKCTTADSWRYGSVTANGEIGFIQSCDPKEDVFIFNNTKIVTDGNDIYETPVISNILDEQRKGAITRDNFPWINAVERYASSQYGTGWGTTWPRKYQPAAQYRIINNDYDSSNASNYNRYTNYETGEVGVQWKDQSGNEWNRMSFASRSDDIIVTYIEAPEGRDLDITVTMDHLVEMRNQGTTYYCPTSDYVVTEDANGYAFGMVGKYAIQNRKGNKNVKETLFARGGWGSATRIVTDGNVSYDAQKRDISVPSSFGGGTLKNVNDPKLSITGTNSVVLISKVDRIDTGCNTTNDVRDQLYDELVSDIDTVINKYKVTPDLKGYNTLLTPHEEIHGGMFNNVRIDLCDTEQAREDRALTNTELIAVQNSDKDYINKTFLERIYNNGRFGLICASGYGTTRLSAIWNGAWNPDWSGDFTLDANTNLQISGMNTGNMQGASEGYINFIVRMVADWESDATNIYGMEDAIKAPPRVDGTGEAGSFHFLGGYPHIYVNGITDWLILPMFEYWQCYGNQQIPLGKDIDMERNQRVLDLSDADVQRINETGFMDLEKDILYPMLKKTMNFWLQFVDGRYYTDGNGIEHADDGTTIEEAIAAGDTNCKYIYTPGYSPENVPAGNNENSIESLAYNTTMDISASRDTLFMARAIIDVINPTDKSSLLSKWADFESKIPEYVYASTGELQEWASPNLGDRHTHRHVSHAYVAWPGYESQTDDALRVGVIKAMDARSAAYGGQEASESHGPTHKALVEARLKNVEGLEGVLKYLLTNNYQYSTMMTSHNANLSSTYCTDSAFGIMGAINESLLYSNTGIVEILPTLLSSSDNGSVSGLRARCNTECDITWDRYADKASVTLTSDEDNNTVKVRCGIAWNSATIGGKKQNIHNDDDGMPYVEVVLGKGKAVTIDFTLTSDQSRITISTDTDISNSISNDESLSFAGKYTFSREEAKNLSWHVVYAANDREALEATISADGTVSLANNAKGNTYKVYAVSTEGTKSNEVMFHVKSDSTETFTVNRMFLDDDLGISIVNDAIEKNIVLIWSAYDASGKLVAMSQRECKLGANEFKSVVVPLGWELGEYRSTLYIWDKESLKPYTKQVVIR